MTDHILNRDEAPAGGIGFFEKYLSVWVALCIIAGIALGNLIPGVFGFLASLEYASVNLVVAVLIWAMVFPMMVNVDFASLSHIGDRPKGLVLTLAVNWLIKPFTMAALGVLFFEYVFAPWIEPADAQQYIAGLILLGAAPCTAMVFVWSQLTRGDATYTLVQVSLNDVVMIFAFAPIVALLLGVTDIAVPWETLLLATGLYVVIPLVAGFLTRKWLTGRASGAEAQKAVTDFTASLKPVSVIGLLVTVVLLFGFQGHVIVERPILIVLIAVPLLIQSYGIFFLTYFAARIWKVPFNVAAPCALIGTSNFFELAVAVAISLFGLNSGAALATVVGVLVEVAGDAVAGGLRQPHPRLVSQELSETNMTVTIYHNPKCGTSRNVLAMLREAGEEPQVIDYLKTPPGREKLVSLIAAMGVSPRAILRQKGTPYDELGLGEDKWSDDELIDFMVEHPILMNRPIVETPLGTKLCRPSETVLELLPEDAVKAFTKEDGEVVR